MMRKAALSDEENDKCEFLYSLNMLFLVLISKQWAKYLLRVEI